MRNLLYSSLTAIAVIANGGVSNAQDVFETLAKPLSTDTAAALTGLKFGLSNNNDNKIDRKFKNLQATPNLKIPSSSTNAANTLPFAAPDSLIIQVAPDSTEKEIAELIEKFDFSVIESLPNLGQIRVRANLKKFFEPQITDNNANETIMRGIVESSNFFKGDPRIIAAAPDVVLNSQNARPFPEVSAYHDLASGSSEFSDWGVADIRADQLWNEAGAQDGAILGVMDAGFARHDDLTFLKILPEQTPSDHGNHVAGIACARHDMRGMKGVIPRCFVTPRSGDVYPIIDEGGNILQFMTRFGQIQSTLDRFIDDREEVGVYNISLGYNWMPNFGINTDDPANEIYRQMVAAQGELMISPIVAAARRDAVIVSAGGNDSRELNPPMSAKFASPFNWAAMIARERGIANNTLVVEAHDQNGDRAVFSNVDGNISCPGVGIISTVAHDSSGNLNGRAYGEMSGTSMASPYCASGVLLLGLVRPNRNSSEIIDCVISTARSSTTGAPQMDVAAAAVCLN